MRDIPKQLRIHQFKDDLCRWQILISSALFTLLFLVFLGASEVHAASMYTITDDATGGSCTLVGTWDAGTKTCTLSSDLLLSGASVLEIAADGITLDGDGHSIGGNSLTYATKAIEMYGRNGNTIKNINVQFSTHGVYLEASSDNTVMDSRFLAADIYLYTGSNNNVIITNDVSRSHIEAYDSSSNVIENNECYNSNNWGIRLKYHADNNVVRDNRVHNDPSGISLTQSSNGNQIINNQVYSNDRGIDLSGSNDNTINGNSVSSSSIIGITIGGWRNLLTENTVSSNATGLYFSNAFYTTAYRNSFVNNTSSFSAYYSGSWNKNLELFSQPLPVGGNYWSEYDEASEGCVDNNYDHICDAAYLFDGFRDDLPWTLANGWEAGKPNIVLSEPVAYWASMADYIARELSVPWMFTNNGSNDAVDLRIVSVSNSSGVTLSSALPVVLGDVPQGGSATAVLVYDIPDGVAGWFAGLSGTVSDPAGISYSLP